MKLSKKLYVFSIFAFLMCTFNNSLQAQDIDISTQNEPLKQVEVMPEFPGGQEALMSYLQKSLIYPAEAVEDGIQGRVFVQFVVNEDGSVDRVKAVKDPGGGLGAEAIRVIKNMPTWKPGQQGGENVRVFYTLPVHFALQ